MKYLTLYEGFKTCAKCGKVMQTRFESQPTICFSCLRKIRRNDPDDPNVPSDFDREERRNVKKYNL